MACSCLPCSGCTVKRTCDRAAAHTQAHVQVRQAQADRHSSVPAIPVTVRQLEAVIRISEAIARMALQPVATQEHVAKAIQLFNFSTMEAVKSGLHDNLVHPPCCLGEAGCCTGCEMR